MASTVIRISDRTRETLEGMIASQRESYDLGRSDGWWKSEGGPTIGEMIQHLCDHISNDKRRVRESAERKARRLANEVWEEVFGPPENGV